MNNRKTMPMKLSDLVQKPLDNDVTVQRVVDDSRMVNKGDVFVFDGRIAAGGENFIAEALKKGAAAVVSNMMSSAVIYVENPGAVLARWATAQHPNHPQNMVAVTGTNGKTSVAWFYKDLFTKSGKKAASIGTMGVHIGDEKVQETGFTSPTALKLHPILDDLAQKEVDYVCLEASSHALDLDRLAGVEFKAAAFTNLTQDHLDYHGNMDAYFRAKAKLFEELPDGATAVVNILRQECWPLAAFCKQRDLHLLTYGSSNAELVVNPIQASAKGLTLALKFAEHKAEVEVPVIGTFQAENLAAAIGLALATGLTWPEIIKALPQLSSVPGRMELIKSNANQPTVVVDYAHTDDALKNALASLKPLTKGKVWCVFGAGGDRDKSKRAKMGHVARMMADHTIVTDDNPRSENPSEIRAQIMAAVPQAQEIADREQAIKTALMIATSDDVVLIAGKGHESGQIIGKTVLPFDDRDVAHRLLESL